MERNIKKKSVYKTLYAYTGSKCLIKTLQVYSNSLEPYNRFLENCLGRCEEQVTCVGIQCTVFLLRWTQDKRSPHPRRTKIKKKVSCIVFI